VEVNEDMIDGRNYSTSVLLVKKLFKKELVCDLWKVVRSNIVDSNTL
jgi:hypothetical protein